MDKSNVLNVKASCGTIIKRFEISPFLTYEDLICMLKKLLEIDLIKNVKFLDDEKDLITISTEEEFSEALKTVSKTNGMLRVFVNESNVHKRFQKEEISSSSFNQAKICNQNPDAKLNVEQANKLQYSQLPKSTQSSTLQSVELNCISSLLSNPNKVNFLKNTESRKISNDLPVDNKAHGSYPKAKRSKKKKGSSSSDSDRSSSRSSMASSSSSSSDEVSLSSVQPSVKKYLKSFKKKIYNETAKELQTFRDSIKNEVINTVTHAVLQKLEGAVIHSVPGSNLVNPPQLKKTLNSRPRYQHRNVTCDNCELEIFGPRYKCGNCSDYDLCEDCESVEGLHSPSHVFLKIHYPSCHAGRKIGGKSRPLLQTNIYEEREKEREKEDLLQRKLSSGSEVNVKALDIENLKSKIIEVEKHREFLEIKKSEWKKLKKEAKRNKKSLAKKLKQHGKFIYKSCDTVKSELPDQNPYNKNLQDSLLASFSGLHVLPVKSESSLQNKVGTIENESKLFETHDYVASLKSLEDSSDHAEETQSDSDVVVVNSEISPLEIHSNQVSGLMSKPDLVGCTSEYQSTDDFIVVSKFFDLNVPIDGYHYPPHLVNHDESLIDSLKVSIEKQDHSPDLGLSNTKGSADSSIDVSSAETLHVDLVPNQTGASLSSVSTPNEIVSLVKFDDGTFEVPPTNHLMDPIDLVASVHLTSRQPPDIAMSGSQFDAVKYVDRSHNPILNVVLSQPASSPSEAALVTQPSIDCSNQVMQYLESNQIRLLDQANAFYKNSKEDTIEDTVETCLSLEIDQNFPVFPVNRNNKEAGSTVTSTIIGAVSTVANTISNAISPKSQMRYNINHENVTNARGLPNQNEYLSASNEMQQLFDMGFCDRVVNQNLLTQFKNDVDKCIDVLLKMNDSNNWSNTRH